MNDYISKQLLNKKAVLQKTLKQLLRDSRLMKLLRYYLHLQTLLLGFQALLSNSFLFKH